MTVSHRITGGVFGLSLAAMSLGAAPSQAQDAPPVVVELYTSQGCSACPSADALMAQLSEHDNVIALALHVDYWDYIGWKDVFAQPHFTARQKAYAKVAGRRSIYTPQMIVDGVDDVMGTHPMDVMALVQKHGEGVHPVSISLTREADGSVLIRARSEPPLDEPLMIQLVRYTPNETVEILRGENAGRTVDYTNIVRDWSLLGEWDTQEPLELTATPVAETDGPVAVIAQRKGPGRIEAAARID